jgi:hypothetical protein
MIVPLILETDKKMALPLLIETEERRVLPLKPEHIKEWQYQLSCNGSGNGIAVPLLPP